MLIHHPRIYLDDQGHHTHALFCQGGRVLATGQEALELAEQNPAAAAVRLGLEDAACLFPALTDAHLHLWDLGQRRGLLDLKGQKSLKSLCQHLKRAAPTPSGWVMGHGWDQHDWPDWDARSLATLDALFPHTPVCLHRLDYHAVWANSVAMKHAGISLQNPAPVAGGHIELDPTTGTPTGILVDMAAHLVTECIPEPSDAENQDVLGQNAAMLHAHGVSCGHMAWMRARDLDWLQNWRAQGTLPLRIYCMVEARDAGPLAPFHDPTAWCSARCIKYFADGAMGSKGALLHEPYLGEDHRGLAVIPAVELAAEIPSLMSRGFQVAVHAIGDLGATGVLDAFAMADPEARAAVRPRLEHAQIMRHDDIERLGDLGVLASIQPIHLRSDAPWAARVLRPHQLDRLFQWRTLARHAHLAGGSDFPIDDPNPWHGIATAISRQGSDGRPFHPQHALTRQEALALYLSGPAWAAHWEGDLGALRPGFCADFTALGADPFHCSLEELWGMEVRATWIGGKKVWEA